MYFRNYGLPNMWLNRCLKSPVPEDTSTGKMVRGANNVET